MYCEQCHAATTSDNACFLMASIVCGECFLSDNDGTLDKWQNICLGFYVGDACEGETVLIGTVTDLAGYFSRLNNNGGK